MPEKPIPWGPITEGDGPPAGRATLSTTLWAEIMLRLEKTLRPKWLHVPFKSARETKNMRSALHKISKSLPAQVVELKMTTDKATDTGMIYARRGPNWKKREAGVLAHLQADPADGPSEKKSTYKPTGRPPGRPRKNGKSERVEVIDFE